MNLMDILQDADVLRHKRSILNQLYMERSSYEPTWRDLSKFINPYRGSFDEQGKRTDGSRRDDKILDPYPMQAHAKCAAGLHSGLTSPSRPWFELSLQDHEKAEYHTVKLWLQDCKEIMMAIYAKSNVYNMLQQVEAELSQFGTAASLLLQDYNTAIWCRAYTCGEYAGGVDARGRSCQFARKFRMLAWQMVKEFGLENVSQAVRDAYENKNYTDYFDVYMLIEENPSYDPDVFAIGNFKWRSYYWEPAGERFLKVSGYHEKPFLMPRWEVVANSTYGVGPGHKCLGDCKQVQKLEKADLRMLDQLSDPAMVVPGSIGKVSRLPGTQTTVPAGTQGQIYPLFQVAGSRQDVLEKLKEKHQLIAAAFYNDLFVMLSQQDNPQMTAREVAERHEEKLLMLSPVLEQMHNEVLIPLTKRTFEICMRNGIFPEMPEEIDSPEELKVEFVSLLAQAQKMVDTPAIERTVAFAGNLMGAAPEIMDNLDLDAALRKHAALNGAPEDILRDEADVKKIREARAQQQAQQEQMAQAAAMAKPLKDSVEAARLLADTPVSDASPANILLGGA